MSFKESLARVFLLIELSFKSMVRLTIGIWVSIGDVFDFLVKNFKKVIV